MDLPGEGDKKEKARLAVRSFNDLLAYHRRNSIWLSSQTARHMSDFIEHYRGIFRDFAGRAGYPEEAEKWTEVWQRFDKEFPKLREVLEEEFRASLGDTRAKLARLQRRSGPELPQSREDGS
jgi:hypothetical protein